MEKLDKKWHLQREKLVKFQRQNGHRVVPQGHKHDRSPGQWVRAQRHFRASDEMRRDRKSLLDEIEFVWKVDRAAWKPGMTAARVSSDDKKWQQERKKLVTFEEKSGHCVAPRDNEEDKALGWWVGTQRNFMTTTKCDKIEGIC
jgi:hypothetical protein